MNGYLRDSGSHTGWSHPLGMRDIIPVGATSVRLNDRKLMYLLLSCGFLFSFAMDYRQKYKFRLNLCVTR